MGKVQSRTWTWNFDSPAEKIWPVLADTARFNEAAELPDHQVEEIPQADGSVRRFARGRLGPLRVEWEEGFGEWVENRYVRQVRRFKNGPFRSLHYAGSL